MRIDGGRLAAEYGDSLMEEPPRTALIVLMGALGDAARGLALVNPLKRSYPGIRISWLIETKWEPLVRLHRGIDRVVVFRRERGLRAVPAVLRELRAERYDLVLDLQRHLKSGLFSWFSRGRRVVGFHRRDAKELNWIFSNEQISHPEREPSKLEHYLMFLDYLGVSRDSTPDFGIRPAVEGLVDQTLRKFGVQSGCYLAVLGSTWPTKDYPEEGYQRVLTLLTKGQVVLVGAGSHRAEGERLARGRANVINLVGQTDLCQLLALLSAASVAFGPDSGPAHLAGAVGTPYVALFGPTSPERVAPFGSEQLVVRSAVGCSPCYRRSCPGLDSVCMKLIAPEAVVAMIGSATSQRRAPF